MFNAGSHNSPCLVSIFQLCWFLILLSAGVTGSSAEAFAEEKTSAGKFGTRVKNKWASSDVNRQVRVWASCIPNGVCLESGEFPYNHLEFTLSSIYTYQKII